MTEITSSRLDDSRLLRCSRVSEEKWSVVDALASRMRAAGMAQMEGVLVDVSGDARIEGELPYVLR